MGTTLTGTTPQDTYDSLIKVTDNGPLSGTAKYLSDGLGNDSVLALSTANVGIGTNSPNAYTNLTTLTINGTNGSVLDFEVGSTLFGEIFAESNSLKVDATGASGTLKLLTNSLERMRIDSAGNVGIGTSSPSYKLQADVTDATVYSSANTLTASPVFWVNNNSTTAGTAATIRLDGGALNGNAAATISSVHVGNGSSALTFGTRNLNGNITERVRILADGGLTFNGDTAAANALDDYEEGTWTMGVSFGGGTTGITYSDNIGTYTKIGRQVTVHGFIILTSKGSSTGTALITGLPFTTPSVFSFFSSVSLWLSNVSYTSAYQGYANRNATTISLDSVSEAGVTTAMSDTNFANNSRIIVNLTYFV